MWRSREFSGPRTTSSAPFSLTCFSTLFTLEVERVWLFMSPFVMAPLGRWLWEATVSEGGPSSLRRFAAALAVNTFAAEGLLYILW